MRVEIYRETFVDTRPPHVFVVNHLEKWLQSSVEGKFIRDNLGKIEVHQVCNPDRFENELIITVEFESEKNMMTFLLMSRTL